MTGLKLLSKWPRIRRFLIRLCNLWTWYLSFGYWIAKIEICLSPVSINGIVSFYIESVTKHSTQI